MLDAGVPVGAGTDATRVASYNPWIALYWMVTGKTVGGFAMYGADNRLEREAALRLWTVGSSWFSHSEADKGRIKPGKLAELAGLSKGHLGGPDGEISDDKSDLSLAGGN